MISGANSDGGRIAASADGFGLRMSTGGLAGPGPGGAASIPVSAGNPGSPGMPGRRSEVFPSMLSLEPVGRLNFGSPLRNGLRKGFSQGLYHDAAGYGQPGKSESLDVAALSWSLWTVMCE